MRNFLWKLSQKQRNELTLTTLIRKRSIRRRRSETLCEVAGSLARIWMAPVQELGGIATNFTCGLFNFTPIPVESVINLLYQVIPRLLSSDSAHGCTTDSLKRCLTIRLYQPSMIITFLHFPRFSCLFFLHLTVK